MIGKEDRDASGQKIETSTVKRLRTWDSRAYIHSSSDRNLIQAFNELNIMKDKLALSDAIVEKSAYIYRKARTRGLVRGRTTSGIMAAAIYVACREIRTPRTLKDIAAAGNIRRKALAKTYRKLIIELDFKVPNIDPMKCIVKVANKANLSEKTVRHAISIMSDVTDNEISAGKDPMALAATVLYVSCIKNGENIKQNNISNAAGITGVTLRNRFKDLKSQLDLN
jgi:transcription initiation factor TFIIB